VREDKEVHNLENRGKPPYSIPSHPPVIPPESKSPPDRKKWGIVIGIVIVIIVIVVCVPVGVVVPKSNK